MKIKIGDTIFEPGWIPTGHRLVVFPLEVEEKTEGGIVLPGNVRDKEELAQIEAYIISIGDEAWHDRPGHREWCSVGDHVMITKYGGLLKEGKDGKKYRIISDLDVVAIKEKE